jgi:hypothetical protein
MIEIIICVLCLAVAACAAWLFIKDGTDDWVLRLDYEDARDKC